MARFLVKEDVERWLELRAQGLERMAQDGWASYGEVRGVRQALEVLKKEKMNQELAYLETRAAAAAARAAGLEKRTPHETSNSE